ncbi:hypothetical protein ACVWZZ_004391 [Bradyrhizobium sp. LM6.10]
MGTLDGIIGCVAASVGLSLVPRVVASPAFAAERTGRATTVVVHRKDAFVYSARAFMECAGAGTNQTAPPVQPAVALKQPRKTTSPPSLMQR